MSRLMLHQNTKKEPVGMFGMFSYTGEMEWDIEKKHWRFLTSGELTPNADMLADIHLVGGGQAGGHTDKGAIGGQGGESKTFFGVKLNAGSVYTVVVGSGGAGKYIGQTSTAIASGGSTYIYRIGELNCSVHGGSATLSNDTVYRYGSGGGGRGEDASGIGGDGGSDGSDGMKGTYPGTRGQGTTTRAFGEPDGELFSGGGAGTAQLRSNSGYGGAGGGGGKRQDGTTKMNGDPNTGGGGSGAQYAATVGDVKLYAGDGGSGIMIIRKAVG